MSGVSIIVAGPEPGSAGGSCSPAASVQTTDRARRSVLFTHVPRPYIKQLATEFKWNQHCTVSEGQEMDRGQNKSSYPLALRKKVQNKSQLRHKERNKLNGLTPHLVTETQTASAGRSCQL